jgi:hypothetical protein
MEDGTVVNTDKARQSWDEATYWNGHNHISKATGSQWNHETLYESRKGRFYKVWWSQYEGTASRAEWLDEHEAVRWLLHNEQEVPGGLQHLVEEVEE